MLHEFRTSFCRLTCVAGLSDKIGTQTHTHTHTHTHTRTRTHTQRKKSRSIPQHTHTRIRPQVNRPPWFQGPRSSCSDGPRFMHTASRAQCRRGGSSRDLHRTLAEMHQAAKRELKASSDPLRAMNSHRTMACVTITLQS